MSLVKNIHYLRKKKDLTQEQLALKLVLNRPVIGAYEEGRAEPRLKTLRTMMHFFEMR